MVHHKQHKQEGISGREGWQLGMGRKAALLVTGTCCLLQDQRGSGARICSQFGKVGLCQHLGLSPGLKAFPTGSAEEVPIPSQQVSFLTRRAHLALLPWHPHHPIPAVSSISAWQTLAPMQARGPWNARLP